MGELAGHFKAIFLFTWGRKNSWIILFLPLLNVLHAILVNIQSPIALLLNLIYLSVLWLIVFPSAIWLVSNRNKI